MRPLPANIAEMRQQARRTVPRPVFDFADGAAEDETTLRRNELAFGAWQFRPCPLNGAAERDLSIELFGHRLALPLVVGPTGLGGLFWPDGERAAARASASAGTAYCLSHGSVCTLEALAATGAAPRYMQVFIYKDRGFTRELVERARAAAYDGLVLTIDNQLLGNRERDRRNGFAIPPRFAPADLVGMTTRLPWLMRMRHDLPKITFGNYVRPDRRESLQSLAGRMAGLLDPGMAWPDVAWLRDLWPGPFLLKGILHPSEAARACDYQVDGIIVSNHGGRQLDGALATLEALPPIVDCVAGRLVIGIDGGIRRGADVVKALALGARCVWIGRPQLWGLSVGGEAGVRRVLDIYRQEIDRVLGLCGVGRLQQLNRDLLLRATF